VELAVGFFRRWEIETKALITLPGIDVQFRPAIWGLQ
jgi:hypothetical protein